MMFALDFFKNKIQALKVAHSDEKGPLISLLNWTQLTPTLTFSMSQYNYPWTVQFAYDFNWIVK